MIFEPGGESPFRVTMGTRKESNRIVRTRLDESFMRREPFTIWVVSLGLLLLATPMLAHHSGSMWDRQHHVTLKGTVTEVTFSNPHVQIHFKAKDDKGNPEQWIAESGPPQRLYRVGWNSKTIKMGDQITVTGAPSKDGRRIVNIRELVGPGGQTLYEGAD